jgi:hypothetical protein
VDIPCIYVDFNEMIEPNLVLLSKYDYKKACNGNLVYLYEGLCVCVYMDDEDEFGNSDNLIAEGIVARNKIKSGWAAIAKWCCRIGDKGIYHESEN